ncbi:MAG: hypothetical protein E6G10_22970 [Actinobacteria bacterium]|nr:MAG: hypothetical protein E6G10_22970 [Actinomycetota bacterium]
MSHGRSPRPGRHGTLIALLIVLVAAAVVRLTEGSSIPPGAGGFPFVRSLGPRHATIWAVGDGANGGANAKAVARLIAAAPADELLYLGDVYEDGTPQDFKSHYATTYGRFASRTAPTPGNHDWHDHATGYDPYWRKALRRRRAADWYAFQAGGWQLLSLDSEADHGTGSPQLRWLRSQLRPPGTCRLAFWHRPRYSAGTKHGDQDDMAPVWNALRGHAAIVLNGHEHDMQPFKPIDEITEFVTGAGGHELYSLRASDRRLAFGDDTHYGALRLRLHPAKADFAFIATEGRVLDSGSVPCHGSAPTVTPRSRRRSGAGATRS